MNNLLLKKKRKGFHSLAIEPLRLPFGLVNSKVKLVFKPFSKLSGNFLKNKGKHLLNACLQANLGQSQDRIVWLLRSTEDRVTLQSSGFKFSQRVRIPVLASKFNSNSNFEMFKLICLEIEKMAK